MSLKLNSIDRRVFDAAGTENSTVRVNGKDIHRRDLVATGRLIAAEKIGAKLNARDDKAVEKYNSRLNERNGYDTLAQNHKEKLLMFCAAVANRATGEEAPTSAEAVMQNANYARNEIFLATLAAIVRDVIQPLMFHAYDDVAGRLMQFEPIPLGGAKEIDIKSNDVFFFEDSSWGAGRSATYNWMHGKTITLNPQPYQCNVRAKWYQLIVNGDPGDMYAAIMGGMWNKIYAEFIGKLKSAASNTAYIPTGLTAATYTTANWNTITTKVAAINGVRRSDLVAFGEIGALSAVLPTDGTVGAITGLQYGLGEEWFRRGFLPNAGGVDLIEIMPVIVPGTQNSTIDTLGMGNNIFVAAKAGYGYAPIYAGYYEGTPMTLEFTPVRDGTADYCVLINATAALDFKPVFASKVGVITNVG